MLSHCYCSHQVFWCQADNKGKTLRYHIKRGGGGGVCADLWDPLPGSATAFHLSLQDLGNGTALIVWFKKQTKQNDNSNNKHLQFCKLSFFKILKKKDTECFKTKCDCSAGCENDEKDADNGLQDQRVWSPDECADIFSQRLVSWKSIFCLNANKLIPSTY